jgi:hypothetical protein
LFQATVMADALWVTVIVPAVPGLAPPLGSRSRQAGASRAH